MAVLLVATLTWVAWPGVDEGDRQNPLWTRLLVPPDAQLVTGLGTVALGLAGQLALLIGWGRSRSLVDYAGQYRTWTRAGMACWLFAMVSRLGLDADWRDWALSRHWPRFWNDTELLVLLPTLLAGSVLGSGLRREVARCQPSRTLLMLATTLYLSVVALKLGQGTSLSTAQRLLLIQNGVLAAHVTLLLCFWIHARHVLYESCDPVGESRRAGWLSAPHWLMRWPQPFSASGSLEAEQASRRERDENRDDPVRSACDFESASELTDLVEERTSPPREIDDAPRRTLAEEAGQSKPKTRQAGPAPTGAGQASVGSSPGKEPEVLPDRSAESPQESELVLGRDPASDAPSAPETDESSTRTDKTSAKGLSKRERRRLQQEERLRQRAGDG
jgi:hypothetical protein